MKITRENMFRLASNRVDREEKKFKKDCEATLDQVKKVIEARAERGDYSVEVPILCKYHSYIAAQLRNVEFSVEIKDDCVTIVWLG